MGIQKERKKEEWCSNIFIYNLKGKPFKLGYPASVNFVGGNYPA